MIKTGNLELIKKINRSLVLDLIRSEQPISRAMIAKHLGLSRATVSSIVDQLISKKFVVELGLGTSTKEGGRRGIELGFNPKSAYGVGVDIGGTKILIVITDLDGEIVFREKFKTTQNVDEIVRLVQHCLEKSEIDQTQIVGMGMGVPGIVDSMNGFVFDAPALKWENLNLLDKLKSLFPFPIFINNDVRCAALGERWLGKGDNTDNMFFIAIGTGVGSAIIANGELVQGHRFAAGEVGYFIDREDVKNNRLNRSGQFGTFEFQTSGSALNCHGYTSTELFVEYAKGNREVEMIIDNFVIHLSTVIANTVSLLNPEKVVIGGGVSESLGGVIDKIRDWVARLTPIPTEIELACLGGDAGGLGAIAYVFQKIQESDSYKGEYA